MEAPANRFEAWAVVEMFGHVKEVGFVTTEYYGGAALFRVDTPELPDREFVLERAEYGFEDPEARSMKFLPAGAKVRRKGIPPKSRLVGPGAIYSITPCTEETARRAIERLIDRPLILLELPANIKELPAPDPEDADKFDEEEEEESAAAAGQS